MLKELLLKNRSYRRFEENYKIEKKILKELIELTRISASSANKQPLKYILINEPSKNEEIFPHLAWAGYLSDWDGPQKGERPSAYIIIIGDKRITTEFSCDFGIAAQSILLGAAEKNLGGCMIGAIKKLKLKEYLKLPDYFEILLVVAIGKPAEKVVIEELIPGDNIKYWRDKENTHHVPKRSLEEIILG